jgi:hypothetical protein
MFYQNTDEIKIIGEIFFTYLKPLKSWHSKIMEKGRERKKRRQPQMEENRCGHIQCKIPPPRKKIQQQILNG